MEHKINEETIYRLDGSKEKHVFRNDIGLIYHEQFFREDGSKEKLVSYDVNTGGILTETCIPIIGNEVNIHYNEDGSKKAIIYKRPNINIHDEFSYRFDRSKDVDIFNKLDGVIINSMYRINGSHEKDIIYEKDGSIRYIIYYRTNNNREKELYFKNGKVTKEVLFREDGSLDQTSVRKNNGSLDYIDYYSNEGLLMYTKKSICGGFIKL